MEKSPDASYIHVNGDKEKDSIASRPDSRHVEDATARIQEVDLERLSREALTWRSRAVKRMLLVVLVQGLSTFEALHAL